LFAKKKMRDSSINWAGLSTPYTDLCIGSAIRSLIIEYVISASRDSIAKTCMKISPRDFFDFLKKIESAFSALPIL
jgi:hypothetical protein